MQINEKIVQDALIKQRNTALFQFIAELPNLIALIVLAIMGRSLILFADTVGSATMVVQAWIVYVISKRIAKNKSHEYDYGMGKFESFGAFNANTLMLLGLVVVFFSSIAVLLNPVSPSGILLYAIILKTINTSIDVWLFMRQRKISKTISGKLTDAQNHIMLENIAFDFIALSAILILYLFRDYTFAAYFEPLLCLIYSAFMMIKLIKPMKQCVYDLLDKTMDEDVQLKIIKAMSTGYDLYDSFEGVRTRSSGQQIYVDLLIGFDEDKTYAEIEESYKKLNELVLTEVPNCVVSLVITEVS